MRNRRPSPEHEQAVARRLAALSGQWEQARDEVTRAGTVAVPPWAEGMEDWSWDEHTQVRGAVVAPVVAEPAPVANAVGDEAGRDGFGPDGVGDGVRAPGRHAARRPTTSALGRVAEAGTSGLDRVGLRLAHLVWVAVFAAVALAGTSWWLVRAKESVVVTPVASQTAAQPSPQPSAGATPATTAPEGAAAATVGGESSTEVVVDVAGKVRRPGIVVLPQGSRVVDAVEAAGGARRGVNLQSLNLARVLVDGEQIVVGAPAPAPGAPPPAGGPQAPGGLVNLNLATQAELEALPGVGPVTAAAIVDWRTTHGGFSSVEDLLEVHGIGEVTMERLSPLVTV
ncbi:helix-hairpin-helix domain-containing protein [Nocardioides daphniae]|uniref:ComEA family DNA-binding protein n=1 Tax=Nocardioides daphniae TaxID=402297 RepID=A0A4P7UE93_9ACTN|nr:helix-hairpin-helix domain-containing protein [Nocardioides daphniae]QCC77668.1 ComEA family DNA-binding protein [Nocardioides daphniae]GGD29627.1 hypothetical protein GCM10007231_31380 [Nocardioides daphniae]